MEIKLLLASINGSLRKTSLFFVLPTYVEIILMRCLHDPTVTKLCQNPWNGLWRCQVYDQNLFLGGGGGKSEECLKWGGLESWRKHLVLNREWVKAKLFPVGEGIQRLSLHLLPIKLLARTPTGMMVTADQLVNIVKICLSRKWQVWRFNPYQ